METNVQTQRRQTRLANWLWQKLGKPNGQSKVHWNIAEELVEETQFITDCYKNEMQKYLRDMNIIVQLPNFDPNKFRIKEVIGEAIINVKGVSNGKTS